MAVRTIIAASLLRRGRRVDSWFVSRAGLNLYRGCAHDCAFCDGRAETYRVDGEFGRDVQAKANAPELLRRELGVASRRAPSGFVLLGGGVGDSYQPAEKELGLARRALEALADAGAPVHVLTRSALVLRDVDLLERIGSTGPVLASFSFSTTDDRLADRLEPGSTRPSERLRAMETLRSRGIPVGVCLMPILPVLADSEAALSRTVRALADAGAQYVVPAGLTLKEGRQKEHYLGALHEWNPGLAARCRALYGADRWERPVAGDEDAMRRAHAVLRRHRLPCRIPRRLFDGLLSDRDRVVVMLEHMDAFARARGEPTRWGGVAGLVARSPELPHRLLAIGGLAAAGPEAEGAVRDLLREGTCAQYERLASFDTCPRA